MTDPSAVAALVAEARQLLFSALPNTVFTARARALIPELLNVVADLQAALRVAEADNRRWRFLRDLLVETRRVELLVPRQRDCHSATLNAGHESFSSLNYITVSADERPSVEALLTEIVDAAMAAPEEGEG